MTSQIPIGETLDGPKPVSRAEFLYPKPWIFHPRGIACRIFFTCWLVYVIHVATNAVREIFPAISVADHFSFQLDEYGNLLPDLFYKPGYGWHIDGNPGAGLVAAVPYTLVSPFVNIVVAAVNRSRAASGLKDPPQYNSPWPMARAFYTEAWHRGLDVKIGLAAVLTQLLCMAPISALGVVAMFWILRRIFGSDRTALWLALLYAFGTPVFYRAGILNQNMMIGHFGFIAFLLLWNPGADARLPHHLRVAAAGFAGALSLVCDYSGALMLGGLFCYAVFKAWQAGAPTPLRATTLWYAIGAAGPVLLLWYYQWRCFGNFILPVEHWMPLLPGKAMHAGYQGFTLPKPRLIGLLLFDYRFGLFVVCPLMLLALASPWINRGQRRAVPSGEFAAMLAISAAFVLFFGGWASVTIQYTYGLRYIAPILPFFFIPTAIVLVRLPRFLVWLAAIAAVAEAWCMAMYRDVERGFGVLDTVLHVFIGGFQLPALTVLSRMGRAYGEYAAGGVSPLPVFALTAAILLAIWSRRSERRRP